MALTASVLFLRDGSHFIPGTQFTLLAFIKTVKVAQAVRQSRASQEAKLQAPATHLINLELSGMYCYMEGAREDTSMADALPSITGDIAAAADVTVNTKGGWYTAILKKSLRERLGRIGDHLTGAAIQFANGQAIVVLAGGMASDAAFGNEFRVRQIARDPFEIELQDGEGDEVDEVTASFLRMKKDQFEKGQLRFSTP